MTKPARAGAPEPARPADLTRLLESYFDLAEQEAEAAGARAKVRDRILVLRAEARGYDRGLAEGASAARKEAAQ